MSREGAEHAEKIVRKEHCNWSSAVTAAPRDQVFQLSNFFRTSLAAHARCSASRFRRVFFELVQARKPAVSVVAVAAPFKSTVQLPFPENVASVTGNSSPTGKPTGAASRKCPKNRTARRLLLTSSILDHIVLSTSEIVTQPTDQ